MKTTTAKFARDKENAFARMVGEGTTPILRFRKEQAPITRLVVIDGNTLELDVALDIRTLLPRRK